MTVNKEIEKVIEVLESAQDVVGTQPQLKSPTMYEQALEAAINIRDHCTIILDDLIPEGLEEALATVKEGEDNGTFGACSHNAPSGIYGAQEKMSKAAKLLVKEK